MNLMSIITMIFGRRGTGKSNTARNLLRKLNRFLVIDRCGVDYTDGVIFDNIAELKKFWDTCYQRDFRLIYRPPYFDDEILQDEIDTLSRWVYKCGNMTFLLEELNVVFDGKKLPKNLNTCIFMGRKRGISIITASQRPKGYGKNFFSQADLFYIFATHDSDDLKYFRDCTSEQAAEQIKNLNDFHYVKFDQREKPDNRLEVGKHELI